MKSILITAGSTSVPIDNVRVISNIFRGRTGHAIAQSAAAAGHRVTLLTSGPGSDPIWEAPGIDARRYKTFDDLRALMEKKILTGGYDAIVHSAAVSDYRVSAVRAGEVRLADRETGAKIRSDHASLTIELVPTEKLVDLIRDPWGFTGTLVKFKLQVGLVDEELIRIARRSMETSAADLIVANCLEWAREYAYVLDRQGGCERVTRQELPAALLRRFA